MSNIWSDSFNEIRDSFFESKDPYTEAGEKYENNYKKTGKKTKDYDKDGTVEDGAEEYSGVIDNAINDKDGPEVEDVKKRKKISNKINTSPTVSEEYYNNPVISYLQHRIANK